MSSLLELWLVPSIWKCAHVARRSSPSTEYLERSAARQIRILVGLVPWETALSAVRGRTVYRVWRDTCWELLPSTLYLVRGR